ncbi:unnamed protein product [Penicillium nalgiovense]|nr:unnamed protein product [Penicillium nalgiovense]
MCATAIDHLQNHHLRQGEYLKLKTGVAFFFFDFNRSSQQDDCDMLRSLLWQLSEELNDEHKQLQQLRALKQSLTRDVLTNCLHNIMKGFSKVFILIDALDESPAGTARARVLSTIEIMRNWNLPCLHLLVTSRDLVDIHDSLNPQQDQIVVMKNAAIQQDIANYIGYRLESHLVLKKYKERHREIQNLISERSQCAFRYAVCLFDHIDTAASLSQLNELVSSLPSSLDAAYEVILSNIPEAQANDAGRILRILCISSRPLTVDELIHALAVDLGQKSCLDIEGRPFDIIGIRLMLGCLIELTWKEDLFTQGCIIIQIAHLSVREYLESDKICQQQQKASRFAIKHSSAHMEIAQTCLLYILDPAISQREQSQDKLVKFPFTAYAAKEWFCHYKSSDTQRPDVKKLVVELFMDRGGCFNTWIQLRGLGDPWKRATGFACATDNHTTPLYHACLLGLAEIVAELVTFYDVNATGGQYGNALQAAISQGHIDVVCTLLDGIPDIDDIGKKCSSTEQAFLLDRQETGIRMLPNDSINVNARGGEYGTSLIAASYNGNRELVLMLLRKGLKINDQVGQYGNALAAASLRGHEAVVQVLLDNGADFNASGEKYGNALIAASGAGHSEIVQTLLDRKASIDSRGGEFGNAFWSASWGGHTNVLQMLLKSGAEINAEGSKFGTALSIASFRGHMAAVQMLIDHGANVNASSGRLGSALQAASLGAHIDLVKFLLDKKANVNASGGRFGNALQAASFGTRELMTQALQKLVRGMISKDVPILYQSSNALEVAAFDAFKWDKKALKEVSEAVLPLLANHSPAVDSGMRDPLIDASVTDRGALVQLLLDRSADPNAPGGEYGSALQAASAQGLETVVKILLNANADVQASGGLHGSALELASNQNHEGIVQILQEATSGLLPQDSPS